MGTGLSTTGVMNFSNNLISAEPEMVINLLNEKSEIPDFTGITVYSQQLGDVAAPQQELTSAQRIKLEKIYGGIVETGGGNFVYNEIIANPVDDTKQYPSVTPVQLPSDAPISFEEVVFEEENIFEEPVFLTEEKSGLWPTKMFSSIRRNQVRRCVLLQNTWQVIPLFPSCLQGQLQAIRIQTSP